MPMIARGILGLLAGYATGAMAGAILICLLSANTHDKSLEITMTAAFVTGPLGAVIGMIGGILWKRRSNAANGPRQ